MKNKTKTKKSNWLGEVLVLGLSISVVLFSINQILILASGHGMHF